MRSLLITAADLGIVIPGVRGIDYFLWEGVAGDPYPFVLSGAATFDAIAGKPAVKCTEAASQATGRFLPYVGPNTVDGLIHQITFTFLIYVTSGGGDVSWDLGVDATIGATATSLDKVGASWKVSNGVTSSAALLFDTWYRVTKKYTPGTSISTYVALETVTTDTLVGTRVTGLGVSAPRITLARIAGAGPGNCYMSNAKVLWSTT